MCLRNLCGKIILDGTIYVSILRLPASKIFPRQIRWEMEVNARRWERPRRRVKVKQKCESENLLRAHTHGARMIRLMNWMRVKRSGSLIEIHRRVAARSHRCFPKGFIFYLRRVYAWSNSLTERRIMLALFTCRAINLLCYEIYFHAVLLTLQMPFVLEHCEKLLGKRCWTR